jgi:hypothetical protein
MDKYPQEVANLLDAHKPLLPAIMPFLLSRPRANLLSLLFDAPESVELIFDEKKNTLLHLAAEYIPDEQKNGGGPDQEPAKEPIHGIVSEWQLKVVQTLFEFWPEALEKENSSGRSPYLHRIHTFPNTAEAAEVANFNSKSRTFHHDAVCNFLKDKIMHLPDREKTIRLLGGEAQGTQKASVSQGSPVSRMHDLQI